MSAAPLPKKVLPVVLGITSVLVLWIAWGSVCDPEAMWAPGHLSRSHTKVVSCSQCHEPFHGPSAAKCVGCHSEERFARGTTPEVGQRHLVFIREQRSCLMCHAEHRNR